MIKRTYEGEQPEDYKLIPLTKGKFAKVSNEDYLELSKFNWCMSGDYAYNLKLGLMHRYITGAPPGTEVDHIYGDTLDNRRSEIRIVSRALNAANKSKEEGREFKGIHWRRDKCKWCAEVKFEGIRHRLGYFEDKNRAAEAYDLKSVELRGSVAYNCLNFPDKLDYYILKIRNDKG